MVADLFVSLMQPAAWQYFLRVGMLDWVASADSAVRVQLKALRLTRVLLRDPCLYPLPLSQLSKLLVVLVWAPEFVASWQQALRYQMANCSAVACCYLLPHRRVHHCVREESSVLLH